jgi:hypothetical protein
MRPIKGKAQEHMEHMEHIKHNVPSVPHVSGAHGAHMPRGMCLMCSNAVCSPLAIRGGKIFRVAENNRR